MSKVSRRTAFKIAGGALATASLTSSVRGQYKIDPLPEN
jgi:hypothetical protein